ncbi:MAG: ERCC4 domain-containing protein [Ignisphaera sp.]
MIPEPNYIFIDVHEPELIVEKIKNLGIPYKIENLEIGDYIIGDFVIERKSTGDFYNSLRTGRIFEQLYKMKQANVKGFLVIIGDIPLFDFDSKQPITKEKYEYYLRSLETIQVTSYCSYGIAFIRLQTIGDFIRFIETLWKYSNKPASLPTVSKKGEDILEIKTNILTSIPGIGRKIGYALAKQYKLIDLFNMDENTLSNIEICGRKLKSRASKIKWVLNT